MLQILNELKEIIYISDPNTYKLYFMNIAAKKVLNIENVDIKDKKCYEVLLKRNSPCPFCTNKKLSLDKIYEWEFFNPLVKRNYLLRDKLIQWDNKIVRMEVANDITKRIKILQDTEEFAKNERFIIDCIKILHKRNSFFENINSLLKKTGLFFNADRTYIFEFDNDKKTMSNTFEWCNKGISAEIQNLQNYPFSFVSHWIDAFNKGKNIYIKNIETDCKSKQEYECLKSQNIKNLVVVPLTFDDNKLYGYIGVDNPKTTNDVKKVEFLFSSLSDFIVSIIERQKTYDLLQTQSFMDSLTKLQNRNKYINDLKSFKQNKDSSIGIIYIDMNGLKKLNDSLGHQAGDSALIKIADILLSIFEQKYLYRIGGDEFVVIKPEIEEEDFNKKIKILQDFSEQGSPHIAIGSFWNKKQFDFLKQQKIAEIAMYKEKNEFYENLRIRDKKKWNQYKINLD